MCISIFSACCGTVKANFHRLVQVSWPCGTSHWLQVVALNTSKMQALRILPELSHLQQSGMQTPCIKMETSKWITLMRGIIISDRVSQFPSVPAAVKEVLKSQDTRDWRISVRSCKAACWEPHQKQRKLRWTGRFVGARLGWAPLWSRGQTQKELCPVPLGKAIPQWLDFLKGIFPATALAMRPDLYGLASMVSSENKEPKRWGHLKMWVIFLWAPTFAQEVHIIIIHFVLRQSLLRSK